MPSERKVIFLGGIHGVGKSTFARELAERLGGETISASQLIREARNGELTWDSSKRVSAISENQRLLVSAFQRRTWSATVVILDGHFTLMNKQGDIERLSEEVFEALFPSLLVVLTDSPESIAARLEQRDGVAHDIAHLEQLQDAEMQHARKVGHRLAIRTLEAKMSDADSLIHRIVQNIGEHTI